MNHHVVREIAKVAVGLFVADIIVAIWLGSSGFLPLSMFGISWTASSIVPGIVFDLVIILFLAHIAWNTHVPVRVPTEKGFLTLAGLIFLIVCALHLLRLVFSWNLALGTFEVPLWLSWVGAIVTAYLSYSSLRLALRKPH